MRCEHKMIGYDARRLPGTVSSCAEPETASYIIRQDVKYILSVDTYIWPSFLPFEQTEVPQTSKPGLRDELQDLRLELIGADTSNCWIIGVSVVELLPADLTPWERILKGVAPAAPDSSWRFLGFDVADGQLLSGLANCGFPPGTNSEWVPFINANHLLDSLSAAKRFREGRNRDVPEHAPFYVFGLWCVDCVY